MSKRTGTAERCRMTRAQAIAAARALLRAGLTLHDVAAIPSSASPRAVAALFV